jgi:hypothetical protein
MADYDQYGNPIPPADAEATREQSGDSSHGPTFDASTDPMSPNYVSPDTVTITAPSSGTSWMGFALIAGLLYFLMSGEDS